MIKFNEGFSDLGITVTHHFGDDGSYTYIKEVRIPAGRILAMHEHTFTHKSILVSGEVILTTPKGEKSISAPAIMTMVAGVPHEVCSITECVWLCVHATNENNPDNIDHTLVRSAEI